MSALSRLRNHLAHREHVSQRELNEQIQDQAVREAMREQQRDRAWDALDLAVHGTPTADEAEAWLAGGAA